MKERRFKRSKEVPVVEHPFAYSPSEKNEWFHSLSGRQDVLLRHPGGMSVAAEAPHAHSLNSSAQKPACILYPGGNREDITAVPDEVEGSKNKSTLRLVQDGRAHSFFVAEMDYIPRFSFVDLRCHFNDQPQTVLLIKRPFSPDVTRAAADLAKFMAHTLGLTIVVEPAAAEELAEALGSSVILKTWHLPLDEENPQAVVKGQDAYEDVSVHRTMNPSYHSVDVDFPTRVPPNLWSCIDFIVCLGGDGTMLWASSLFPESVPPAIGVSFGSLGYLTGFTRECAESAVTSVCQKPFNVSLRCRLQVVVYSEQQEIVRTLVAANECVIDRGRSSHISMLDVYCNDEFFTTVAADGLILATPTGSTAYSMSAGGSVVHPKVPCLLFTPICPHSLSFRPLILPDSAVLKIMVPHDSRGPAWVAVDGRCRTEMKKGMHVIVSLSAYPFPMVVPAAISKDKWLDNLKKILNWNVRIRQHQLSTQSSSSQPSTIRNPVNSFSGTQGRRTDTREQTRQQISTPSDSKAEHPSTDALCEVMGESKPGTIKTEVLTDSSSYVRVAVEHCAEKRVELRERCHDNSVDVKNDQCVNTLDRGASKGCDLSVFGGMREGLPGDCAVKAGGLMVSAVLSQTGAAFAQSHRYNAGVHPMASSRGHGFETESLIDVSPDSASLSIPCVSDETSAVVDVNKMASTTVLSKAVEVSPRSDDLEIRNCGLPTAPRSEVSCRSGWPEIVNLTTNESGENGGRDVWVSTGDQYAPNSRATESRRVLATVLRHEDDGGGLVSSLEGESRHELQQHQERQMQLHEIQRQRHHRQKLHKALDRPNPHIISSVDEIGEDTSGKRTDAPEVTHATRAGISEGARRFADHQSTREPLFDSAGIVSDCITDSSVCRPLVEARTYDFLATRRDFNISTKANRYVVHGGGRLHEHGHPMDVKDVLSPGSRDAGSSYRRRWSSSKSERDEGGGRRPHTNADLSTFEPQLEHQKGVYRKGVYWRGCATHSVDQSVEGRRCGGPERTLRVSASCCSLSAVSSGGPTGVRSSVFVMPRNNCTPMVRLAAGGKASESLFRDVNGLRAAQNDEVPLRTFSSALMSDPARSGPASAKRL